MDVELIFSGFANLGVFWGKYTASAFNLQLTDSL
jgi:hypothetical protein